MKYEDTFLGKLKIIQNNIENIGKDIEEQKSCINLLDAANDFGENLININDEKIKPCTGRALIKVCIAIGIILTSKEPSAVIAGIFSGFYVSAAYDLMHRSKLIHQSKNILKDRTNIENQKDKNEGILTDLLNTLDNFHAQKDELFTEYYKKANQLPDGTRLLAKAQLSKFMYMNLEQINNTNYVDYFNEKFEDNPNELDLEENLMYFN